MPKNDISVLIYASNDEQNIARAVTSAKLISPHVIVVDIGSTDLTASRAKAEGARIHSVEHVKFVELVRMNGIREVRTDWFFILDSDEVITLDAADEIRRVISSTDERTATIGAYRIPRKNIFGSTRWLKHGGWWPDYQTRLIRTRSLKDWPSVIHAVPVIEGQVVHLTHPLLHYSHGNFHAMVEKTIIFEGAESDLLTRAGRPSSTIVCMRKFLGELNRRLILSLGFLDGSAGITESIYQAFSKTITYLLVYEKSRTKRT